MQVGDSNEVVVYSKANCPQCVVTINQLSKKGVPFKIVKIDENKDVARWLVGQGHRQVPVVYVDGVHIPNAGLKLTAEIVD